MNRTIYAEDKIIYEDDTIRVYENVDSRVRIKTKGAAVIDPAKLALILLQYNADQNPKDLSR